MMIEMLMDWWWWLPAVGILGGGDASLNPFSKDFAKSESGWTTTGTVPQRGKWESGVLGELGTLNAQQQGAILQGIDMARQPTGFQSLALSPEDQAVLDQAYAGAEAALRRDANLFGQDVMGRSGLTGTSTPVTESILREFLPQSLQLQSQKAQYGLGLGLNMRQLGENARQFNLSSLFQGGQITPTSGLALLGNLERTRMARAGQQVNGFKIGSPMDNMEQASRTYKNVMEGSSGFMAMSDVRLKRDLLPVSWKWKDGDDREYLGIVAQEIERSHPHLVARNASGHLMVDYGTMVAMLLDERRHLYAQLAQSKG
jgi:hypothetical protein